MVCGQEHPGQRVFPTLWIDADAEADCSGNRKGVKDWITASDTAFAIPWTMVELVTMVGAVRMGGDDVVSVVVADDDVAAAGCGVGC